MKLFGIKPYRRMVKKVFKIRKDSKTYPNLLLSTYPAYPNHIWATDFTYIKYKGRWIYVSTILDLFTREIVGVCILTTHNVILVQNTLLAALFHKGPPLILHSDGGSEYKDEGYNSTLDAVGIKHSMSAPGCPWENGYQESFYKGFKIQLGDPNRFDTLGELVAEIYNCIHYYNHHRIHSALKTSPVLYLNSLKVLDSKHS